MVMSLASPALLEDNVRTEKRTLELARAPTDTLSESRTTLRLDHSDHHPSRTPPHRHYTKRNLSR